MCGRSAGRVAAPVRADMNYSTIFVSVVRQRARYQAHYVMTSETASNLSAHDFRGLDWQKLKSSSTPIRALRPPAMPVCLMG